MLETKRNRSYYLMLTLSLFCLSISSCGLLDGTSWSDAQNLKGKVKLINESTRRNWVDAPTLEEVVIRLNEEGEVTEYVEKRFSPTSELHYKYRYDDGTIEEIELKDGSDESISKEESVKSSGGVFLVSEETFNQNYGTPADEGGEIMQEYYGYLRSGVLGRNYTRDRQGKVTKVYAEVTKGEGGYLSHTTNFSYDEQGNLTYKEKLTEKTDGTIVKEFSSFEYEAFDSNGNWTSRKEHSDGKSTELTSRILYYYE